jgi:hypothetical protein
MIQPTLRTWTTNLEGIIVEDSTIEVTDLESATTFLTGQLYNEASDLFLHNALKAWFLNGYSITNLHEGGEHFWNAKFDDGSEYDPVVKA